MPATFRFVLLLGAVLCGGFFGLLIDSYARIDDPKNYSTGSSALSFFIGVMFAAPFWIPAIIPSRYPVVLNFFRRVSAAGMLVLTFLFGTILWHNISRIISGFGAAGEALVVGVTLTTVGLAGLFILIRPELRVFAKRAAKPADPEE